MSEHVDKLAEVLTGLNKATTPVPPVPPVVLADRLNRLAAAYDDMQGELRRQATELTSLRDEVTRMADKQ